jgi:hypothetical protein
VRRFTLITLVCLLLLLVGAGAYQLMLANRGTERFPGPVPGTPLPTATPPG